MPEMLVRRILLESCQLSLITSLECVKSECIRLKSGQWDNFLRGWKSLNLTKSMLNSRMSGHVTFTLLSSSQQSWSQSE